MANVKKKNVNFVYDKKSNKVVPRKNVKGNLENKNNFSKEKKVVSQKDKNRQKYQSRQQKYYNKNGNNAKKKVLVNDEIINSNSNENKKDLITNTSVDLLKKKKKILDSGETVIVPSVNPVKKKIINLKVNKEKTKDKFIIKKFFVGKKADNELPKESLPLGNKKEEKKARIKKYLKESFGYALIITIINMLCIYLFDYVNILKLFDVKILNTVVTAVLSLLFNYAISFFIDCLITEVWVAIKNKHKKEGVQNGSCRNIEGECRKDIQNKE